VSAEIFYAGQRSAAFDSNENQVLDFSPPPGYSGGLAPGNYQAPGDAGLIAVPQYQISNVIEEKFVAQLGNGVLKLAALQNRVNSALSENQGTSATLQLWGGGYLNGSPTLTYFNGGTYTVGSDALSEVISSGSNNRDVLANYTTSLGQNFHAGFSLVKSYYDTPCNLSFNANFGGFLFSENLVTPSAISETTNEYRLFIGGNLSNKTSLDLSGYFVNASYHIPDPNNIASYKIPGTNVNYIDQTYMYAAPRLGFVWRPTAAVAIRAAAGGGFAGAPLNSLIGSGLQQFGNLGGTELIYYTDPPNPNLTPEKSFAFTLGTDIRLPRNTTLSFDVYRADLTGQIYSSFAYQGITSGPFGPLPTYVQQYKNIGISRYQGITLDLRHDVPHGVYWALSGGLTRGYVVSLPAGFYNAGGTCNFTTGANCVNLNIVPGINFNGTLNAASGVFGGLSSSGSVPYSQGLGLLGYRWSSEKYVNLQATYYGNNNSYYRPAFLELDGNVGYPLTKNISLLAAFRNITGVYDAGVLTQNPANMYGAPTLSGRPYALFGGEYGPRTVIVTLQVGL
jgi:outer membrane receptor protein involved in Fe transport